MKFKYQDKDGLFKNIFIAYFILLLHILLLAGTGITIILFRGVYHYLPWIMAGLGLMVLVIAWTFYRRMKHSTTDIRSILALPEFQDRTVEIRLLGGLASFKINAAEHRHPGISHHAAPMSDRSFIEHDINRTERKILKLTALYEKELISKEEFDKAKQNILQG